MAGLEQELKDPKSKKLAVLSEMLGLDWRDPRKTIWDDDKDTWIDNKNWNMPMAITTDLRIPAWQVRDKMAEKQSDRITYKQTLWDIWYKHTLDRSTNYDDFYRWMMWDMNPTDIINAGLTVYRSKP